MCNTLLTLLSCFQLILQLTRDFIKESWLSKTGPNKGDAFRKRWCSLDKRKLMYYEDPLVSIDFLVEINWAARGFLFKNSFMKWLQVMGI